MVLWVLLSILLASPAWAAIPNTVGWHNTNQNLNTVCHFITGNWAAGCKIIEAWGNSDYDDRRNRMFFTGGGHSDGRGNEMIAFNVGDTSAVTDSQTVSRLKDGTSFTNLGTCTQNGSWRSHHGWNMGFVRGTTTNGADSAANDRYVFSIQGTSDAGDMGMDCFVVYNPNNNTFTISTHHADLAAARAGGWWGGAFANDQRQGKLVAMSWTSILYWDVNVGWTKPTQTAFDESADGPYLVGVVDPVRRRYYAIGNGNIMWWNISGTGTIVQNNVTVSGTCATATANFNDGPPGVDYYPYRDKIVIWRGTSTIYYLDPVTHTCTSETVSGGPSVSGGSGGVTFISKRFRFVAKDNMFVTCNNTDAAGSSANDQCWALRLDLQSNDSEYLTRCRWHGVTACESFDNISDYTNGVKYFNGDGNFDGSDLDTTIKVSGTGALRFNLPAGRAQSNISGDWRVCLKTPCVIDGNDSTAPGYTTGEHIWLVYSVRITPTMVTNLRDHWRAGSQRTGWKHANLHNGSFGSCGAVEITGTISIDGATNTQTWYKECSPGIIANASGQYSAFGPYYQEGNNTQATATNGFWCNGNSQGTVGSGTGQGCFNWQWQNEWIKFVMHGFIGANGAAASIWEGWIIRENSTTPLQIQNVTALTLNYNGNPVNERTYNQISFTPYMTNLSTSAPVSANMWIDGFTVSSKPPPSFIGSSGASGGDTTPPAAPTGVTIQ